MQKIRDGLGRSKLSQTALQIFDDAASGGYQSFEDAIAALETERDAARIGQSDVTNALGFIPGQATTKGFVQGRNAVQNVRQVEQLDQLIAVLQEQNKRLAAQQNAGAMAGKAAAQRER